MQKGKMVKTYKSLRKEKKQKSKAKGKIYSIE